MFFVVLLDLVNLTFNNFKAIHYRYIIYVRSISGNCGVDETVDTGRLLAELNTPYILKYLDTTIDEDPYYRTIVYDVAILDTVTINCFFVLHSI